MREALDLAAELLAARHPPSPPPPWTTCVVLAGDGRQIAVLSILRERVPEDRRTLVGEYVARANLRLRVGCLDLCWDDGTVRARAGLELHGAAPNRDLLSGLIEATLDETAPLLLRVGPVARGELTPAQAAAQ